MNHQWDAEDAEDAEDAANLMKDAARGDKMRGTRDRFSNRFDLD